MMQKLDTKTVAWGIQGAFEDNRHLVRNASVRFAHHSERAGRRPPPSAAIGARIGPGGR